MKQQKGFTLIELIIVIVILGILAVTAAPRFFDFSTDARISTLGGLKASLQGAAQIEYAKNAIKGKELNYPAATQAGIADAAGISATEWDVVIQGSDIIFAPRGFNGTPVPANINALKKCYVQYSTKKVVTTPGAEADAKFTIVIKTDEC